MDNNYQWPPQNPGQPPKKKPSLKKLGSRAFLIALVLVIVELKQDGLCYSPMKEILQDMRVKKLKVSKYCVGTVLANPTVKANRFKRKIRLINKTLENQKQI